jgi:hypothetical protein
METNDLFTIRAGDLSRIAGHACHVADSGTIVLSGNFTIKCNKFAVGPATPADTFYWVSPPSDATRNLYYVQLSGGSKVAVRLTTPAEIWPDGGTTVEGATIVGRWPTVYVGASRAMLAFPEALSCATPDASIAPNPAWVQTAPVIGQPGCLIGRGTKLATVAGVAGWNLLVNIAAVPTYAQGTPVYVELQVAPPNGDGTFYPNNPTYFAFRANDLPATGIAGAPGLGVKLGDLMPLTGTMPLCFMIDHTTTAIGFWLPTAEEAAPGAGNIYMAVSAAVYTLLGKRRSPLGGFSMLPPGVVPATIPSAFFCEQEVRLGT